MKMFRRSRLLVVSLTLVVLLASRANRNLVLAQSTVPELQRPNILWITAEDMSATLGCYGDPSAITPNLDRLAEQSCRYTHAFATSPVCSPSRSCLINGCIATHTGTHPMRSQFPLPESMQGFPSLLRKAGYFTSNNVKTDYNTASENRIIEASWDANGDDASWNLRSKDQPFFAVHNLMTSHQSRTMVWPYEQFQREIQSLLSVTEIHDPSNLPLPPYYPDTKRVRRTWARFYDCVTLMDKQVGEILRQLENDGLADETIVFFYSDHGSGMPRHKRVLFDTGTHIPLLIRFPEKYKHFAPSEPGRTIDRLVSFEDFGPTVLSLAGLPSLARGMLGKPFLGKLEAAPRQYVQAHRDRVDEIVDMARSLRTSKYLYIRNYMPHFGYHQPSAWVDQGEVMRDFYELAASGNANGPQSQFMNPSRRREALFDCEKDPLNLYNLVDSPAHQDVLVNLRQTLRSELLETNDLGFVPEIELLRQTAGTTPLQAAASGMFDFSALIQAAELVGSDDYRSIRKAINDSDPCVRYWGMVACTAADSLPERLLSLVRDALGDESIAVRIEAAGGLAKHTGEAAAYDALLRITRGADETSVLHAARTLEWLANPKVHGEIQMLAERFADAPGDTAWFIRFTTSAYLARVTAPTDGD